MAHRHHLAAVQPSLRRVECTNMTHDDAAYKLALKDLDEDSLFEAWSQEYDAKCAARVAMILAEMDARQTTGVITL
jgi:hypothetical protein